MRLPYCMCGVLARSGRRSMLSGLPRPKVKWRRCSSYATECASTSHKRLSMILKNNTRRCMAPTARDQCPSVETYVSYLISLMSRRRGKTLQFKIFRLPLTLMARFCWTMIKESFVCRIYKVLFFFPHASGTDERNLLITGSTFVKTCLSVSSKFLPGMLEGLPYTEWTCPNCVHFAELDRREYCVFRRHVGPRLVIPRCSKGSIKCRWPIHRRS